MSVCIKTWLPAATVWLVLFSPCGSVCGVNMTKSDPGHTHCGWSYCTTEVVFSTLTGYYMSAFLSVDRICNDNSVTNVKYRIAKTVRVFSWDKNEFEYGSWPNPCELIMQLLLLNTQVGTWTCWRASRLVWSHRKRVSSFLSILPPFNVLQSILHLTSHTLTHKVE